jgi:hypothetical protein
VRYHEQLAERVRRILDGPLEFREQKMFGGVAFMAAARCSAASSATN